MVERCRRASGRSRHGFIDEPIPTRPFRLAVGGIGCLGVRCAWPMRRCPQGWPRRSSLSCLRAEGCLKVRCGWLGGWVGGWVSAKTTAKTMVVVVETSIGSREGKVRRSEHTGKLTIRKLPLSCDKGGVLVFEGAPSNGLVPSVVRTGSIAQC